jgi:hypothetical protein
VDARLDVRISFLQLMGKQQSSAETQQPLSDPSLAWDEAVERTSVHSDLRLNDLLAPPGVALEMADGTPQGFQAMLKLAAEALPNGACKLHIELENRSELAGGIAAKREEALPQSFVSAHLLLGISGGQFVSLLDPGEEYGKAAAACCSVGVFPVLVGEESTRNMMLCSPIILYDYPQIAPESEGDFFDGTEMDEMLTLRVLTLTDAEKQEIRDGDPRARRILERTEALTGEAMLKTHGVVRSLREVRKEAS